jgi:hypothetical protein
MTATYPTINNMLPRKHFTTRADDVRLALFAEARQLAVEELPIDARHPLVTLETIIQHSLGDERP